jgi:hypothetical protein
MLAVVNTGENEPLNGQIDSSYRRYFLVDEKHGMIDVYFIWGAWK